MKSLKYIMGVCTFALVLAGCNDDSGSEGNGEADGSAEGEVESIELVASNYKNEQDDQGESLNKFVEEVENLSEGNIEIEAFHNAELGNAQESVERTINGSIDIAEIGSSGLNQFNMHATPVPELPYLFDSFENFEQVMNDDEVKRILEENIEKEGLVLLGYRLAAASHVLATQPMESIDDFEGVNLRSPEFEITERLLTAWGARPTILPLPEVYTALQNGVVEGYTATPTTALSNNTYEVAPYLNMTEHMFTPQYLVMNQEQFEDLSEEAQEILLEAGRSSEEYINEKSFERYENDLAELEENGVELIEYDDLTPFEEAVEGMNEELAQQFGDEAYELYNAILEANN